MCIRQQRAGEMRSGDDHLQEPGDRQDRGKKHDEQVRTLPGSCQWYAGNPLPRTGRRRTNAFLMPVRTTCPPAGHVPNRRFASRASAAMTPPITRILMIREYHRSPSFPRVRTTYPSPAHDVQSTTAAMMRNARMMRNFSTGLKKNDDERIHGYTGHWSWNDGHCSPWCHRLRRRATWNARSPQRTVRPEHDNRRIRARQATGPSGGHHGATGQRYGCAASLARLSRSPSGDIRIETAAADVHRESPAVLSIAQATARTDATSSLVNTGQRPGTCVVYPSHSSAAMSGRHTIRQDRRQRIRLSAMPRTTAREDSRSRTFRPLLSYRRA